MRRKRLHSHFSSLDQDFKAQESFKKKLEWIRSGNCIFLKTDTLWVVVEGDSDNGEDLYPCPLLFLGRIWGRNKI